MNMVKPILKRTLPVQVRRSLRKAEQKLLGLEHKYRGLATPDIFDKIYRNGAWGTDPQGQPISGSGSYTTGLVTPYISALRNRISQLGCKTIVDLGCGDFNVGRNLVDICTTYQACDVSDFIIRRNRARYRFDNVSFRQLDIARAPLPIGDIGCVRQVLQHLCNDDIGRFVDTVNRTKPFKYLVVSEHLPSSAGFAPNLDKPSGAGIRGVLNSGIVLHEAPFDLAYQSKDILCEARAKADDVNVFIRSTLYAL